jgi:hypothetical protein
MSNSTRIPGIKDQEWAQAAGSAKEAAASVGEMACHAASAVGEMANQAACDVGKRADALTASAGVGIQGLGDQLSRNAPHSGMLGNASQAVASSVKHGGEYLEEHKLSGITEDVTELIRRNPIPAIFIAIGLGWFMARMLKR